MTVSRQLQTVSRQLLQTVSRQLQHKEVMCVLQSLAGTPICLLRYL